MKNTLLAALLLLLPFPSLIAAPPTQEEEKQVVILGSGIGALTSALYLSRAGITPIVITGPSLGGTITQSHNVQNWPGELSISGIELSEKVKKQVELSGAILQPESVVSVDLSKRPFLITTKKTIGASESLKTYRAHAMIIALGATPNRLNIPGEENYWSRGVYSCATCDGTHYKGKVVAVVGGGDSALIEAQYLSNIASKVHLFVRKEAFRTVEKERMQKILALPNIQVHYQSTLQEIKGDGDKLTHLTINTSAQKTWQLELDALFLAIGARPNTDLFRSQLELDPSGYILLKKHQMTSIDGVYAIGDVADPEFKQAISAAGDASKAAIQAQQYLVAHSPSPLATTKQETPPTAGKVLEIHSKEQLEAELRSANGPVFVDFYSTYCGPCRTFSPVYEEWAKSFGGKIKFLKVNSAHAEELFRHYQIRAVPTLIILDSSGNIIRRSTGFKEISEVDKRLEQLKPKPLVTPQDLR